jgi:hypothetical protein
MRLGDADQGPFAHRMSKGEYVAPRIRSWFDRLTTNGGGESRSWFDELTTNGGGESRSWFDELTTNGWFDGLTTNEGLGGYAMVPLMVRQAHHERAI